MLHVLPDERRSEEHEDWQMGQVGEAKAERSGRPSGEGAERVHGANLVGGFWNWRSPPGPSRPVGGAAHGDGLKASLAGRQAVIERSRALATPARGEAHDYFRIIPRPADRAAGAGFTVAVPRGRWRSRPVPAGDGAARG